MNRFILSLHQLVAIAAILLPTSATPLGRIQVRDQWMIDESGRVRVFHGFNSVQKGPPWYDCNMLNTTRLQLYREWGFNAVRLGTMWKGVVPAQNVFNFSYIDTLKTIVKSCEDHGMYAILDMHQDILSVFNTSTESDGYEGVPRWLIDLFPPSPHPYPWPFSSPPSGSAWAFGYFTEAVSLAFQQIYDDVEGAIGFMSAFWVEVARNFKDQSSVLGYELINEPWAGNIYRSPSSLLPGVAGQENLMRLYNRLNAAIRAVDQTTLMFYEPVTWGVYVNLPILGTGFNSVPGGAAYRNRSVLSYHYYCFLEITSPDAKYPLYEKIPCDAILGPQMMRTVNDDARTTGGSLFLTEFGSCIPDGNPNSANTVECDFVMSLADKYIQSWTYWNSEFFDESGNINWNVVKSFARVYARAVAGIPTKMTFDLDTKKFRLEYRLSQSVNGATEIFIPLIQFPDGFNVVTSSQLKWTFDQDTRVLFVSPSTASSWIQPFAFVEVNKI